MRYGNLFDPFTGYECIGFDEKKEFLQSAAYCNMLRKMVMGLTGDFSLTVGLLSPQHPELAFTDGKRIFINTLHEMFESEPLDDLAKYCLALVVHESLHPIYSCFQCIKDAATKRANETEFFVEIRRHLFNILEDARIERIGAFKFPGVAYAIGDLNDFLFEHANEPEEDDSLNILLSMTMDFVSVNKVRRKLTGELEEVWNKIIPLAQKAKYADTCSECYLHTKKILYLLKKYIAEAEQKQGSDEQASKPKYVQIVISSNMEGNPIDQNAGTNQRPPDMKDGDIVVVVVNHSDSFDQKNNNGQQGGNSDAKNGAQGQCAGGDQGTEESSSKDSETQQEGAANQKGETDEGQSGQSAGATGNSQGISQSGGGNSRGGKTNGVSNEKSKAVEILIQALERSYSEHQQDEKDNIADIKTISALEEDRIGGFDVEIEFGDFNSLGKYTAIKSEVAPIINNLKQGLKNILNFNVDEMSRYLHSGRIDGKSLSRMPTGAICAKRIEKNDEADLNITVLVDLSGSMSGMRLSYSKRACTILQEVCHDLKIPISILGFQDGFGNRVSIRHFGNASMKGRYAHTGIVNMTAGGGTPLGEALGYMPKFLQKQKETDKLLIVITDGEPNRGPEYSKIMVNRISSDAKVYGLAIGSGQDKLSQIFGSRYIGIDSLERLSKELCKIIEKNLFRR